MLEFIILQYQINNKKQFMNFDEEKLEKQTIDYTVNIQMITFIVITMVVILTLVNFIRIYSSHKSRILKGMATESTLLSMVISDQLSYSKYFIELISKNVEAHPRNLEYIKDTLQVHFQSQKFIDNKIQDIKNKLLYLQK